MTKKILALFFLSMLGCCTTTKDNNSNGEIDCTQIGKELNNCKGCSSRPECGWCGKPAEDQAQCQPQLATEARPDTCLDDWHHNEVHCEQPPEPEKGAEGID